MDFETNITLLSTATGGMFTTAKDKNYHVISYGTTKQCLFSWYIASFTLDGDAKLLRAVVTERYGILFFDTNKTMQWKDGVFICPEEIKLQTNIIIGVQSNVRKMHLFIQQKKFKDGHLTIHHPGRNPKFDILNTLGGEYILSNVRIFFQCIEHLFMKKLFTVLRVEIATCRR